MTGTVITRSLWTAEVVAHRAADFIQSEGHIRSVRFEYAEACERFRSRHCPGERINTDDPKFRRATRNQYLALHSARRSAYNAKRRLETAVRNFSALAGGI